MVGSAGGIGALAHVGSKVRQLVLYSLIGGAGPTPQAVLQADSTGPTVDVSHLSHPRQIEEQLRSALRTPLRDTRLTVVGGSARIGHYAVGSDQSIAGALVILEGDAEVHGRVDGNVVALDGDVTVFPGGLIGGDVLSIGGSIETVGTGQIRGTRQMINPTPADERTASAPMLIVRRIAGLIGLALTVIVAGFGMVTFGRPNLEVVSDTIMHTPARSFVAGLLGQLLVLPVLGMLVVGLVLTIAGTVLLPFAIVLFAIVVVLTALVGLIAVAHAMGERMTRRRMARGVALSPNSYRYVATGALAVVALWVAWVLLGWVPIAGALMLAAAAVVTWTLATAGFGAALLSRGGIREQFAGRLIPAELMTDEYLWATPRFGVPAVGRPEKR